MSPEGEGNGGERFAVELEQREGFEFVVRWDDESLDELVVDEPSPLGEDRGPNATRLLAAAVGNCLSASLLFCLQKSRIEGARIRAEVSGEQVRNENGRLRVGGLDVRIEVAGLPEDKADRFRRCLGLFEDFCIVTQSIRDGVPVQVDVERVGSDG